MASMTEPLRELDDEQAALDAILGSLSKEEFDLPTPAEGWTIRDQVSHLADVNEVAVDTMQDGPRSLNVDAGRFASAEAFTESGCERGRAMNVDELLEWWRASVTKQREAFLALDPKQRVPWGLGMAARTLVTARLMETWAHAGDIRRALDLPVELTPRLRSVAWLILNAIPYAMTVAQTPIPSDRTIRLELDANGEPWRIGPEDATDVIRGDALSFCLVGVQRLDAATSGLETDGEFAALALPRLRAYL
jgi:uncharacterized protein (TIGR03084 family)